MADATAYARSVSRQASEGPMGKKNGKSNGNNGGASQNSDSAVQRRAEVEMIPALSKIIGVKLCERSLRLDQGCKVQIDGYSDVPPVLAEVFARISPPKSGQSRKLSHDVLKLLLVERAQQQRCRKVLAVASEAVYKALTSKSWQAAVLREFGLEVIQVPISDELRAALGGAEARQKMVNSVKPTDDA